MIIVQAFIGVSADATIMAPGVDAAGMAAVIPNVTGLLSFSRITDTSGIIL